MRWLLIVALAGCTSPATPPGQAGGEEEAVPAWDPLEAPQWMPGQAWTYRTLGYWDAPDELTVVAVPATNGWLLAASAPEGLVDEIAWNRIYLGPIGHDHAPLDGSSRLLQFPAANGTAWEIHHVPVVAMQAMIAWLHGTTPGMRATGATEAGSVLVEYAAEAGFVTRFEYRDPQGGIAQGIELVRTAQASSWVAVARVAESVVDEAAAPAEVPGRGADRMLAWAVGDGGHAAVIAPDGRTWTAPGEGSPRFAWQWLDPADGAWRAHVVAPPDGWMYLQLHAVEFISGEL